MFCYNCGRRLSEHDFCTSCGADVTLYKKIIHVSNMYYNEGLEKAGVRDLSGAVTSLRLSLKFDKSNVKARNLLGLVYFEMGEVVSALREWVTSKNMSPEKNIADEYIDKVQSNSTRLDSINQTIKKYNRALALCSQDSQDLAVIQLKKVLSMNPRFIRAHQLLALLYMEKEDWDRAERELRKCMDIDRNNVQTLRYLKEVERMLTPDEAVKQPMKHKKDEAIRYRSENEIIIQPVNVKEPKRSGVPTLLNIAIGLIIGLAVTYFLLVPAAQADVRNQEQQILAKISGESDNKTARIQELESRIAELDAEKEELALQMEGYVGTDGTLQTIEGLIGVAADYLVNRDAMATAGELEGLLANLDMAGMTEGFQKLYQALIASVGPEVVSSCYSEAEKAYASRNYTTAIESLQKAVCYEPENVEVLYLLGQSYRMNGNSEEAIVAYDRIIELYPGTQRANYSKTYRDQLAATIGR